jgi:NitT/TauT family transport system permease protein
VRKQAKNIVYTFLGAASIVAVWWIAAAIYDKPLLLPTPAEALRELGRELFVAPRRALFWRSFFGSLWRSLAAFAAAGVLAGVFAFAGKAFAPLRRILAPVVGVLRAVPTMSVILLLVLWAGGDRTPLFVSGLVIFPVLYSGLEGALAAVPVELEETARLYGGNAWHTFAHVYLPLSAPSFLPVAGGAASLTLKLTVAAEVLAQTRNSIGMLMQQTRVYFEIGRLMALTVAVVVASLLLELIIYAVRKAVAY